MRLQRSNARPDSWADRTLSALRASRTEACEKELAGLGGVGLFDAEATDLDAERLFDQSWYAREEREKRLHTLEELRMRVLSQLPSEIGLVSPEEYTLIMKIAFFGGEMPLMSWEDLFPAHALVRRMWCRMSPEKGRWIRMPRQILVAAVLLLSSDQVKEVRDTASAILDTVDNTLYLAGMMPAETVIRDMAFRLKGSLSAGKPDLYRRLLESAFETVTALDGKLQLIHPGLADPWNLAGKTRALGMDQQSLNELYASLTEVEDPPYDRLIGQIEALIRPELNPEDTAEDLILMAKQGATAEEMRRVLGSRIICIPTAEMVETLREMRDRIPGWMGLNMERVQ